MRMDLEGSSFITLKRSYLGLLASAPLVPVSPLSLGSRNVTRAVSLEATISSYSVAKV